MTSLEKLRKETVDMEGDPHHVSPAQDDAPETTDLWVGALSNRAIAAITGLSEATARRGAIGKRQRDLVKGRDGKTYVLSERARQDRASAVLYLVEHGMTYRQIAAKLGISPATVSRYVRNYEVDR